jgi:hypothetical protein
MTLPVLVLALSVTVAPAGAASPPGGLSFVSSTVSRFGGGIALLVPLQFHCPVGTTSAEYATLQVTQVIDGRTVNGQGGTPYLGSCPLPDQRVTSLVIASTDTYHAGHAFAVLTDGDYTAPWTPRDRVLHVPTNDSAPVNTASRKVLGASRSADGHHVTLRVEARCAAGTTAALHGAVVQKSAHAGQPSVSLAGNRNLRCSGAWQTVSIAMVSPNDQVVQDGPAFAFIDQAYRTVSLTRSANA